MYSPANDRLQHFRRRDHSMAKEYVHWEYHKKQEHNYWVNRDVVWKRVTYYEPGIDERITMYVEDSDNRVTQILDEDYTSDQNESNDDTFQFKRNFDRDSRRSYRKHRRQCADGSDNDSRRSFREGSEILYNSKYHQSKHVNHKNLLHLHPPSRMDVNKSVSNDRSSPCQKPPEVNFIRSCYGLSNELELDTNQNINNIDDVNKNDLASEHVSEVTEYASEVLETITPSSFKPESTKEKSMPLIPDFVNELSYSPEVESEIGTASNTECKRTMELDTNQNINNIDDVNKNDLASQHVSEVTEYASEVLETITPSSFKPESTKEKSMPLIPDFVNELSYSPEVESEIGTASNTECKRTMENLEAVRAADKSTTKLNLDLSNRKRHNSVSNCENVKPKKKSKHRDRDTLKSCNKTISTAQIKELRVVLQRLDSTMLDGIRVSTGQCDASEFKTHHSDQASWTNGHSSVSNKHMSDVSKKGTNIKLNDRVPVLPHSSVDVVSDQFASKKSHCHKQDNYNLKKSELKANVRRTDNDEKRHLTKHVNGGQREVKSHHKNKGSDKKRHHSTKHVARDHTKEIRRFCLMVGPKYTKKCQQYGFACTKSIQTEHRSVWQKLKAYIRESINSNKSPDEIEGGIDKQLEEVVKAKKELVVVPNVKKQHEINFLRKITAGKVSKGSVTIRPYKSVTANCISLTKMTDLPCHEQFYSLLDQVDYTKEVDTFASLIPFPNQTVPEPDSADVVITAVGQPIVYERSASSFSDASTLVLNAEDDNQLVIDEGEPVANVEENLQSTSRDLNDISSEQNIQQTTSNLGDPVLGNVQTTFPGTSDDVISDVNKQQTFLGLKAAPSDVPIQQTPLGLKDAPNDVNIEQTPLDLKDAPNYVNIQQTSLGWKDALSDVPVQQTPLDLKDAPNYVNIQQTSLGLKDASSDVPIQQIPLDMMDAPNDVNIQHTSLGLKDAPSDVTIQPITSCLNNLNESAHQIPLGLRDVSSKVNVQEISPDLNDAPGLVSIQQITSELYDLLNRKVQESSLELIASDVNMQQTTQNLNDVLDELTTPHISPDTNNVRDAVNAPKSSSNQAPNAALLLEELFGAATDIEKSSFHSQQSFMIVPASTIVEVTHKSNSGLTEIRKDTESTQVDTNAVALTSDVDKYFVGRYYMEWTCLFRFEHHESDTTCTLVKCTTQLKSVSKFSSAS
ncbi:uncharacterized protein [Atheta coriaria]|uniref:uncharacterized protein n=1 Tax=Dalotia coriaria TaxID=877792 RepID=UPI0031F4412D